MPHEVDLRELLPDLARVGDSVVFTEVLKRRGIRVSRRAGAIIVPLENDFRLVLTPGVVGTDGRPAWAVTGQRVPTPEHRRPRTHLEAFMAAMAERQSELPEEFALYHVNANLEGGFDGSLPANTWHLVSPNPIEVCDNALTWARRTTGLPLQYKHSFSRGESSNG